MSLGDWQALGGAVDGRRRRVHDTPRPGSVRRAQHVQAAQHIDAGIVVRLANGPADIGLRRGVEHDVGFEGGNAVAKRRPVADIEAMQPSFLGHVMRRAG